jgi:CheY-like chemotaxis protein
MDQLSNQTGCAMKTRLSGWGRRSAKRWTAEVLASLLARAQHRIFPFGTHEPSTPELMPAQDATDAGPCSSALLTHMTQELRTPFQGVLGMLNLLDETRLDGQQRDYVQTARDSAQQLLGMLNDILDVATVASGTLRLAPEPTRLRTLVQEVERLLRASAREKGLTLEVETAHDLPEWVMADPARVRQILVVLLGNAVKFTHKGGITARVSRLAETPGGVCLTVQDTGMGMDAATVDQLFNRICQADPSEVRSVGTSRMGLAVSRKLATMMGGNMQVSSEPGQGSLFTVHLILPESQAPADGHTQTSSAEETRRLRVLVAEDHLINLKYMSILLERMGHEAVFCENGQEALQLLELQRFDVVLLDYHMPVLDGLATTRAIRALQGPNQHIQVVLITADVLTETRQKALAAGVSEFASKPLQAQDLQRALRRCGLLGTTAKLNDQDRAVEEASLIKLEAMNTSAAGLIDTETYTELAGTMPPATMDELLEMVFEPPNGCVHVLMASLAVGDATRVASDASRLKATATLLGFRALVRSCALVERMVHDADTWLLQDLATQVLTDAISTQRALREFQSVLPITSTHAA